MQTKSTYDAWAGTYDNDHGEADIRNCWFVEENLLEPIISAIRPGNALDAACGTGRWGLKLLEKGWDVTFFDQSREMLVKSQAKVARAGFDFRGVLGDLANLPMEGAHYSLLVCSGALIHNVDIETILAGFRRLIAPDGMLIVSDVHPSQQERWISEQVVRIEGSDYDFPVRHFDMSAYRSAIADNDFEIVGQLEIPGIVDGEIGNVAFSMIALPKSSEFGPRNESGLENAAKSQMRETLRSVVLNAQSQVEEIARKLGDSRRAGGAIS
jgi:SAM-dependent methyltransferase